MRSISTPAACMARTARDNSRCRNFSLSAGTPQPSQSMSYFVTNCNNAAISTASATRMRDAPQRGADESIPAAARANVGGVRAILMMAEMGERVGRVGGHALAAMPTRPLLKNVRAALAQPLGLGARLIERNVVIFAFHLPASASSHAFRIGRLRARLM